MGHQAERLACALGCNGMGACRACTLALDWAGHLRGMGVAGQGGLCGLCTGQGGQGVRMAGSALALWSGMFGGGAGRLHFGWGERAGVRVPPTFVPSYIL
jgi:hypothetical protein